MKILYFTLTLFILSACSPVKMPITNAYQLNAYSDKNYTHKPHKVALLVTPPEAVSGYQTEAMLYVKKPFQLEPFAKNSWVDAPASMLYPLLVQSLQRSGYFSAVSSGAYAEGAQYRLDTQLLNLEQNFLYKPSVILFSTKVVLTEINSNKVIASRILSFKIPCPQETPYGGVLAANQASIQLTGAITAFVMSHIT